MFVCCSVAILYIVLPVVQGQVNCSHFLHTPLVARSKSEREEDKCDNCTSESYLCPPWYKPTRGGSCKFGAQLGYAVAGIASTMQTTLQYLYCMTSSNVSNTGNEALGSCLLSLPRFPGDHKAFILPCNISDLNDFMCASTNREGQLCGRCREGFAPPVYSYSLTCVNCTDYSLNWLKYLAVAFGPLTIFSIIISVFHISPTSPYLHGFIFTSNIMCSPNIIRIVVLSNEKQSGRNSWIYKVFFSLFGIWNLDFFRTVYKPFCIHPKVSVMQAFAMDYLVAAYPLTLVAVTYVLVTLHTRNCWLLTKIWKPFRHIMRPILRNFDIQTSLIDSFATLFLLSSIKFQSVSSDLLLPTRILDINGNPNSKTYLYLAGDVEYFGSEHLPFAIIALVVLSMFVILPTLLLFLYPYRCFQQLLNRLHCNFHVLRVFMDVFLGPYKDGTDNSRDLRYFAGAFFLARVIFVLLFGYLDSLLSVTLLGLIFSTLLLTMAIFQPQKSKFHYNVDCVFLFFLAVVCLIVVGGDFTRYHKTTYVITLCVSIIIGVSLFMFITGLIVHRILLRRRDLQDILRKVAERCAQCITSLKSCIKKENDITPDDAEDLAPLISDH